MNVRNLRTRFDLESPQAVADGAGGTLLSYAVQGQLWGALEPVSGRAADVGGLGVSQNRYRILLRGAPMGAPSRPTPRDRLRLGVRCFEITAVREADPAAHYLVCDAVEEITA